MDNRRKAAVLAGAGAAVSAASVAFHNSGGRGVLGLSADFWRGFPIGIGAVFIVAAVVLLMRSKADRPGAR